MKKSSLVSVILPVYNTGAACIKLIMSLIQGTYKNLEIIIINDGSTDDSLALLKEFSRELKLKNRINIKLFTEENQGVSAARNYGITKSTGKYLCFIDSDDSVSKDYIASLVTAIESPTSKNFATEAPVSSPKVKPNTPAPATTTEPKIALAASAMTYHRLSQNKVSTVFTKPLKPRLNTETYEDYILRLILTDGRLYSAANKIFRRDIIQHFNIRFDTKLNFAEDTKFVLDYLRAAHRVKYSRLEFVLAPNYIYNYGTPTSTVSMSSLSWGNWQKSFSYLEKWTSSNPSKKTRPLLLKIHLRWRLSHVLAVARSNQSLGHKFQHASPVLVLPALVVVKFRR